MGWTGQPTYKLPTCLSIQGSRRSFRHTSFKTNKHQVMHCFQAGVLISYYVNIEERLKTKQTPPQKKNRSWNQCPKHFSISLTKIELETDAWTVLVSGQSGCQWRIAWSRTAPFWVSNTTMPGKFLSPVLIIGNTADQSELSISRKLRLPHQVWRLPFPHATHHQLARNQTDARMDSRTLMWRHASPAQPCLSQLVPFYLKD